VEVCAVARMMCRPRQSLTLCVLLPDTKVEYIWNLWHETHTSRENVSASQTESQA